MATRLAIDKSSTTSASIMAWAAFGAIAAVFSFSVVGQWLFSATEFAAVPIAAADAMSETGVLKIRVLEIISTSVALGCLFYFLVRPWAQSGRAPIIGLTLVGALISYVLDTSINIDDYAMAFNAHAINRGTWAAFFPGHSGPTRYAEGLFWGPPMYLYFGVLFGLIQLKVIDVVRRRGVSMLMACVISFAIAFVLDLIGEWSIIYLTEAYAWAHTWGILTLLPGSQFQFPLYESLAVALYSSMYAFLLKSNREHAVSFIERGVDQFPKPMQLPLRFFAATGFSALTTAIYFTTFYLFSRHADSLAPLPHYLMFTP